MLQPYLVTRKSKRTAHTRVWFETSESDHDRTTSNVGRGTRRKSRRDPPPSESRPCSYTARVATTCLYDVDAPPLQDADSTTTECATCLTDGQTADNRQAPHLYVYGMSSDTTRHDVALVTHSSRPVHSDAVFLLSRRRLEHVARKSGTNHDRSQTV